MKKINILIFIIMALVTCSNATTVYEDAEDGTTDGWQLQAWGNGDAPINIFSPASDSRVIRLEGGGGPWILGAVSGNLAWNNTTEKTITWRMVMGSRYTVYVVVNTTDGIRYLFYNDLPKRILRHGAGGLGILHGQGGYKHSEYKNVWRTYTRNLETDLKDSEPDNELLSVNGFIYSGDNVSLDDIILYNPEEQVYEDGSGANNWTVSDNSPAGATVATVIDPQGNHEHGNVIELQGAALDNGYQLTLNNSTQSLLQWKSRYYENYSVSLMVQTTQGVRELLYTNSHAYTPSGGIINDGQTIWHEMGGRSLIGLNGWEQRRDFGEVNHFWQTVTRDLSQDIRTYEPTNEFLSIASFEIRGSGLIDDVKMLSRPVIANAHDNRMYEDAEDGNSDGWHVYDNAPAGATITNVTDATRGSRVIELSGDGLNNGYEIGRRTGGARWNNSDHQMIRWSMNYGEVFSVYVAIETTDGARYMKYEPVNGDAGRVGSYLRFGLGSNADNGTWQSFSRNLKDDLHQFEPENELVAIHAFLIRGSGRLDDIETVWVDDVDEVVYEDAENENTEGWNVYVNNSGTATVSNVMDEERGSRVIELSGVGRGDGYGLGATSWWNDRANNQIRWSMNYGEPFTIYISVQTTNGHRYLIYRPVNINGGLSGESISIGLGESADDGVWHTIRRNLAEDIASAEAGNDLVSINSFLIRGSGRLDDIIAH